jgi:single-strand DNA-binding protein
MKVALTGRVQTGTYENKDGVKMPFFEVVAEEQEFVESKSASQTNSGINSKSSNSADRNVIDDMDELPFN